MLGSAQAVTSAPDLKNVMSITQIGTVMPVRIGGGGGFGGGGGHMGGMGGHMGGIAGRGVHGGPTFAGRGFDNGHFNNRHFINDRDFHNRRFINNRFFVAGGPWWWGYDYALWQRLLLATTSGHCHRQSLLAVSLSNLRGLLLRRHSLSFARTPLIVRAFKSF